MRLLLAFLLALPLSAETTPIPVETRTDLKLAGVETAPVTYKGKRALRVSETGGDGSLAIIPGIAFDDGTIEYEFAGDMRPNAPPGSRGFAGIAFRSTPDGSKYECFYQRPANGRADSQEQRNHVVQYISKPDFPWQKLRSETPSKYEVYADMVVGEWVKVRIEVKGVNARIYINGAEQPTMIVSDLKLGAAAKGTLALWVGPGTIAHFANLKITQ